MASKNPARALAKVLVMFGALYPVGCSSPASSSPSDRSSGGARADARADGSQDSATNTGPNGGTPPPSASCNTFAADPGTSCAGSLGEGDTVTLTRSGAFGNKPNGARALYVWDFSRGTATVPESRVAKDAPGYGSIITSPVAPGSSGAWKHVVDYNFHEDTYRDGLDLSGQDLYVFTRMYFNFDGHEAYVARQNYTGGNCTTDAEACWNQKGWRFWHEWTHDWLIGYGDDDATGNTRWGFGVEDEDKPGGTTYDGSMYPRAWHTQDVMVHQGSGVNVADAWSEVAFNGRGTRVNGRTSRTTEFPEPLSRLYWFQVERTGWTASDDKFYAYDIVYIDDSFCRIVMTDQPTWSDSTEHHVEIQVPLTWTADAVSFRVRRPFAGAYVWAVRADATPVRLGRLP